MVLDLSWLPAALVTAFILYGWLSHSHKKMMIRHEADRQESLKKAVQKYRLEVDELVLAYGPGNGPFDVHFFENAQSRVLANKERYKPEAVDIAANTPLSVVQAAYRIEALATTRGRGGSGSSNKNDDYDAGGSTNDSSASPNSNSSE